MKRIASYIATAAAALGGAALLIFAAKNDFGWRATWRCWST